MLQALNETTWKDAVSCHRYFNDKFCWSWCAGISNISKTQIVCKQYVTSLSLKVGVNTDKKNYCNVFAKSIRAANLQPHLPRVNASVRLSRLSTSNVILVVRNELGQGHGREWYIAGNNVLWRTSARRPILPRTRWRSTTVRSTSIRSPLSACSVDDGSRRPVTWPSTIVSTGRWNRTFVRCVLSGRHHLLVLALPNVDSLSCVIFSSTSGRIPESDRMHVLSRAANVRSRSCPTSRATQRRTNHRRICLTDVAPAAGNNYKSCWRCGHAVQFLYAPAL